MTASFCRLRGLLLVAIALLTGCQTNAGGYYQQTDPRLTNSNSAQFFSQSGLQACAIGGGAGALLCVLGDADNKQTCMLAAAVVGCGVGMGANYYLDQRRSQYANREQRLDATIADVRKDNMQLQQLTQTARTVMADDQRKLAQIRQDIAQHRLQVASARQQLASIDSNTAFLRKTLADTKKREQEWRQVAETERRNGARVDTLNAEINSMQRQIGQLEREVEQLYQQRSAIRLG